MPIVYRGTRPGPNPPGWNINDSAISNACHSGRTVSGYFINTGVFITINSMDMTAYLLKDTLNIDEITTTQGATATFSVYIPLGGAFGAGYFGAGPFGGGAPLPPIGADVTIAYSTRTNYLFKGQLLRISSSRLNRGSSSQTSYLRYDLECTNYINLLNRRLVRKAYTSMTITQIVQDLITNYTIGFTFGSVQGEDVIVDFWYFDNVAVGDAIAQLCTAAYLFWFVTPDKTINIRKKTYQANPVVISDGNPDWDQLQIQLDMSQIVNRVYVRGAQKLSAVVTETSPTDVAVTNGNATQRWSLRYLPVNLSMTVDGAPVVIGVENLDPETGKDFMVNYQNKAVRYSATKGAVPNGKAVVFTYQYYLPTLVVVENPTSQNYISIQEGGDGIHEGFLQNTSLADIAAAQLMGRAQMHQFSYPILRGTFTSHRYSFIAGGLLAIDLSDRPEPEYTSVGRGASGTSTGSNTADTFNDTGASWNNFVGCVVWITDGKGKGQARTIKLHTTTQITLETIWGDIPDNTSTYKILTLVVFLNRRTISMLATQRIQFALEFTDTHHDYFVDLMQQFIQKTFKSNQQQLQASESVEVPVSESF